MGIANACVVGTFSWPFNCGGYSHVPKGVNSNDRLCGGRCAVGIRGRRRWSYSGDPLSASTAPPDADAKLAMQECPEGTSCCFKAGRDELLLAQADLPALLSTAAQAVGQRNGKRPNILFVMGDDNGWMQSGCYHRDLMVGETPNIDRIAKEGGIFMQYYAESSCTAGRCAFVIGMDQKSLTAIGDSLAAPSTAYLYDWTLLPIERLPDVEEASEESTVDQPRVQLSQ